MRNIGPVSAGWLAAVGIHCLDDLRRVGAVAAFRKVAMHRQGDVSLLLLYGLHGAVTDQHWNALTAEEREELRRAVEG